MTLNSGEFAGVIGHGFALPPTIRNNKDPIFDYLWKHQPPGSDLFTGYENRRVLGPDEPLSDLMTKACNQAMEGAKLASDDIDLITGYESVSEYIEPNGLAAIHRRMALPTTCQVMPINDEYTNYLSGLVVADSLIKSGRTRNAIVTVGCNWTQYSNYTQPQAISSGDGAGAMIVGATKDKSCFRLVDHEVSVQKEGYGGMRMAPSEAGPYFTKPWSQIDDQGVKMFKNFAFKVPPAIVNDLLKRNGIKGSDITFIPYQASSVLLDPWQEAIKPAQTILSIKELANMTLATVAVNFSRSYDEIEKDWVCMLGVGTQFQTMAVLLKRNG